MDPLRKSQLRPPLAMLFGAALIVAGAGLAGARTLSGPPWSQQIETDETEPVDGVEPVDPAQARQEVDDYFAAFDNDCGTEVLGEYDLADGETLEAFGALVDGLDLGQTSHTVQSVRVLLDNCAAHPNEGLMNALYHHGLNWVRHYEHEQWLQDKFAAKWVDGKPGNLDEPHGNPHTSAAGDGQGSSVGDGPGNGVGNGHAYGHSK